MEKSWYVIHTYSGYENKVKANLESRIESMGMEDKIFRIIIPAEETIEKTKDGGDKITEKKIYPGYLLVEMDLTDESWHVVRNTPGVTGFVGSGSKPTPLHPDEVRKIFHQMGMAKVKPKPKIKVPFEVGQGVRLIKGPFAEFTGVIDEINAEKRRLKILVSIFGRETPVESEFNQVEKL